MFETYKKDLERWALLTDVKPELQALLVVHSLDADTSGVKGKINAGIDEEELKTTEGIKSLLNFLATIYKVDALADSFKKYMQFKQIQRKPGVAIQEFISEWEMAYRKTKTTGCELADMVLAFKLLDAANLSAIEKNLVLTGVDYAEGENKKNLKEQMQVTLKKFVGCSVVGEDKPAEATFLTSDNLEKVLVAKGWTKPKSPGKQNEGRNVGRSRIRSQSAPEDKLPISNNYKGRKNPLGKDYKVLKCFKCKCEHEGKCECPCMFHLANKCPGKTQKEEKKADVALYSVNNIPTFFTCSEDQCQTGLAAAGQGTYRALPMKEMKSEQEDLKEIMVLIGSKVGFQQNESDDLEALIDSAFPRTVSGTKWIDLYNFKLPNQMKQRVQWETSERVFQFGDRE